MGHRFLAVVLSLVALSVWPIGARADVAAGSAALERQDYDEALRQFSDPALARDMGALSFLAWMAYKGLGQKQDLKLAHAYVSLTIMFDPAGPDSVFIGSRRVIASKMTKDEIIAAEAMVVPYLQKAMGKDGYSSELTKAMSGLLFCRDRACEAAALKVVAFGPGAAAAIPRLEALMTKDPFWIPRKSYVFALAMIGTKSIPALCRVAEDREEFRREGSWNAMQAAIGLAALGPSAPEGRDCLLRVMDSMDSNLPAQQAHPGVDIMGEGDQLLHDSELVVAFALTMIGDQDRVSEAAMQALYRRHQGGQKARVMAYVIGMVYADFGPVMEIAPAGLTDDRRDIRIETLRFLIDLSQIQGFGQTMKPLVSDLSMLVIGNDPEIADLALQVMGHIDP